MPSIHEINLAIAVAFYSIFFDESFFYDFLYEFTNDGFPIQISTIGHKHTYSRELHNLQNAEKAAMREKERENANSRLTTTSSCSDTFDEGFFITLHCSRLKLMLFGF